MTTRQRQLLRFAPSLFHLLCWTKIVYLQDTLRFWLIICCVYIVSSCCSTLCSVWSWFPAKHDNCRQSTPATSQCKTSWSRLSCLILWCHIKLTGVIRILSKSWIGLLVHLYNRKYISVRIIHDGDHEQKNNSKALS